MHLAVGAKEADVSHKSFLAPRDPHLLERLPSRSGRLKNVLKLVGTVLDEFSLNVQCCSHPPQEVLVSLKIL